MKKLYFVIMLCVAALFSANAQSAEKVSVKDLNYRFISKLPFTIEDMLTTADPVLSDFMEGRTYKGYAFSLTAQTNVAARLTRATSWNCHVILLDADFELVQANSYSDSGAYVVARLDPGTYYVLAGALSEVTADLKYTLTIKEEPNAKLLRELTYAPVANLNDTLRDSITVEQPHLLDGNMGARAKGYSLQLAAGDVLNVKIVERKSDMYMSLLDKDNNLVAFNDDDYSGPGDSRIIYEATAAGTYKLAVSTYTPDCDESGPYALVFNKSKMEAYYIDPVDGDDAGTGITPSRPLKTFDAAVDKSNGVGIYYLMNDYQFGMTGYEIELSLAKVLPYQKDIHLGITEGYDEQFITAYYGLTLGDAQSEYHFIVDSITLGDNLFELYNGDFTLNNVKVTRSKFDGVGYGSTVHINNCEFTNNTSDFIVYVQTNSEDSYSSLKNTTIKDCHSGILFQVISPGATTNVEIENSHFTSNVCEMPPFICYYNTNILLKSGTWQYNTLKEVPAVIPFAAKLNKSSLAGIYAMYGSTIQLYKDFTMDVNNFIIIDSTSFVNVVENLTGTQVATILPIAADEHDNVTVGYKEGRQVLTGTRSLLAANYQKFALAQVADDIWYLRADGKVYTTPVGIKEDVLANTVIYPNPVTDQATVRISNVDVTDLTIIDAFGRLVKTYKVNGDTEILNLSNLSSGMYFVQFRDHNTILGTQKIIKK